jgi:hypothetical protein
LFERP